MKPVYIAICFLFFIPNLASFADSNEVPDPCDFLLAAKIVALENTALKIIEAENFLMKVRRAKIDKNNRSCRRFCPIRTNDSVTVCDLYEVYTDKKTKRAALKCLKENISVLYDLLARIKADDYNDIIPAFSPSLFVGQIGKTKGRNFYIRDIVDSNNCRVIFRADYDTVLKVWLRGLSTKNLADGSIIDVPPFLRVTGTQDYFTPQGDKVTVFVLEKFTPP